MRDDVDEIVDELRRLSQRMDVVITSGGIGPTHDDVTVKGKASLHATSLALSLSLSLSPSPPLSLPLPISLYLALSISPSPPLYLSLD